MPTDMNPELTAAVIALGVLMLFAGIGIGLTIAHRPQEKK